MEETLDWSCYQHPYPQEWFSFPHSEEEEIPLSAHEIPKETYSEKHVARRAPRIKLARQFYRRLAEWNSLSNSLIVEDALERSFREQAGRWRTETRHWSSILKMIAHPAYLRIIGMGPAVLPLLLRELQNSSDHWLIALNAITGEDPASPDSTFAEAVEAWLSWGRNEGYLK